MYYEICIGKIMYSQIELCIIKNIIMLDKLGTKTCLIYNKSII